MKTKKGTLIGILILFLVNVIFISAVPAYTITTNYNFTDSPFIDGTIYKTDSIVLRITTSSIETGCIYGLSSPPSIPFEWEYGLTHETHLENLEEGLHTYYVRCGEYGNPEKQINFATSVPIYATIEISEEPPLKSGQYKISLITSKTTFGVPTLEYSFDEVVYKQISLIGSGTNWKGNLIIPESIGETVCSFRFSGKDLSEEPGTKIIGDNSFIVDTSKPSVVNVINAIGYQGQIKLSWSFDEEINEFNVYRSESSQVDSTEFYKTSTKDYFYDNEVEKGKTYYYRIAGVDEAGNIGDLSREVYATALLNNYSVSSGLNPSLIGKVDSSISEINSIIGNIEEIKSLIDLKEEKEKTIFEEIKLDKEIDGAISELNSLKRDIEGYKLQDLTEIELNKKLDSAALRLSIIKKKVPEDITIIDEKQIEKDLSEANIQRAFLEYSLNSEYDYKKEISDTLKIIKEKEIKITSNLYSLEIMYLDGTKNEITLVEDSITPQIEDNEDLYFIVVIPKEIAEKSSEIKIMNLEYNVIKDDPVISFKSDTEKIVYYFNKEISLNSIEEILLVPIKILSKEESSKITGNSILGSNSNGSWGIIALALFAFVMAIYFLKIKKEPSIGPVLKIIENIKKSKDLLKVGKEKEAKEIYEIVKEEYKRLTEKEKIKVIESIKKMDDKNLK